MVYLVLAVLCYPATSVSQKLASRRGLDAISVNLALRLSGTVLCVGPLALSGASLAQQSLPRVALIGGGSGVLTLLAGYVVPVLASIIIWGELRGDAEPRRIAVKPLGVGCLLCALVLLGRGPRE